MVKRDLPSYEDILTIEELRREVRMCWDRELALAHAIHDVPEMPSPFVLLFLSRGSHWPEDSNLGKLLQRKMTLAAIPPKSECETGAGVWYRIRQGLLAPRPEELP
ncbi:MAG TPA: hypothetical protein VK577_03600 [Bradyrhizobium sp.]|nr:hypothetical protein [Bradyrhizobium sp.]